MLSEENEGKNHRETMVSCVEVKAWAVTWHRSKTGKSSTKKAPKRSVAEAQAPARVTLLGREPHFQKDRSNVLGSSKGHLDHTSVGEALLFLCVLRHAPADTNISLQEELINIC